MQELSDLEYVRRRPGMYVGDTETYGLHHLLKELLDNSIDQFLVNQVSTIKVTTNGSTLEFSDDGPGLPFDVPGTDTESLASDYLSQFRCDSPTADGHTPHIHTNGSGCGLRIVTALTESCEVISKRNNIVWRQRFSKGLSDGPPLIVSEKFDTSGTTYRLSIDRSIFSADWCQERIDQELINAAYLFPGLRVETTSLQLCAPQGLAELAAKIALESGCDSPERIWWFNQTNKEFQIQATFAGIASHTKWRAFANGSCKVVKGTHIDAFKRILGIYKIKPAIAMIHIIIQQPRFAGPTRITLDVPEMLSTIYQTLKPSIKAFISKS